MNPDEEVCYFKDKKARLVSEWVVFNNTRWG